MLNKEVLEVRGTKRLDTLRHIDGDLDLDKNGCIDFYITIHDTKIMDAYKVVESALIERRRIGLLLTDFTKELYQGKNHNDLYIYNSNFVQLFNYLKNIFV
jgi:hypothetical protein